jgi:hypothetical protein
MSLRTYLVPDDVLMQRDVGQGATYGECCYWVKATGIGLS